MTKEKIAVWSVISIAVLHMLALTRVSDFKYPIALAALLVLVFGYGGMSGSFKKMATFFLLAGAALNTYSLQPFPVWVDGINYMLNISAILVIMQIFTIPIKLGDYEKSFEYLLLNTFRSERSLYFFISCVTHVFSSFLLFGTIPVMLSLLGRPLQRIVSDYPRFASTALTRSYSIVLQWAPGAVNILLAMQGTGATWGEIFPIGVILSVMAIALSCITENKRLSPEPLARGAVREDKAMFAAAVKKLILVVCIVLLLIVLIQVFDSLKIGNNTSCVLLAGLLVAVGWMLRFIRHPDFKVSLAEYVNVNIVKIIDLSVLFISLGVFAKALDVSGVLGYIYGYIGILAGATGIFMLPVISLLIFAGTFVGLHPFIMLVVLGKILVSLNLPFSTGVIASALLFGAALAYMICPLAAIVLTAAKFLDQTAYTVGAKWNGPYGFVYFTLGSVLLMLWNKAQHILR